jgi:hypothetical protein
MENNELQAIEITNKNIPESLKAEIWKVQLRIFEVASLRIWLRAFPGHKDETSFVCYKLSKTISKARTGIIEINREYPAEKPEQYEGAYLNELKEHSEDLFKIKLSIDVYEHR